MALTNEVNVSITKEIDINVNIVVYDINFTIDVTNTTLASHTHVASDITNFSEAVDDRVANLLVAGSNITLTYDDIANTLTIDAQAGTSYTDAQARAAISETITGIDYNSTTGVFSLTSGYVIPTTTEESNWNTAYSWGNHAGLYDALGAASAAVSAHEIAYDHTLLHSPASITDGTTINFSITGQDISGEVIQSALSLNNLGEKSYNSLTDKPTIPTIGGANTVAGLDTQVQYNNNGVFGGADIYYNNATQYVSIGTPAGARFSVQSLSVASTLFKMTTFGAHEIFSISEDGSGFSSLGFGDLDEAQNQTRFFLHDDTKLIKFQSIGTVQLGDVDGYGNANNFFIDDVNNKFYFQHGDLGVGEVNPLAKVHIQGDASGKMLILRNNATTPGNAIEIQASAGALYSYFSSVGHLYLNNPTTGYSSGSALIIKTPGDVSPAISIITDLNKESFLVSQTNIGYPYIWFGDTTGTKNATALYLDDFSKQLFLFNTGSSTFGNVQGGAGTGIEIDGTNDILYLHGGSVIGDALSSITASRFISTVATGTAPFTVTSTTKVTNLNADMLDGLHDTSFVILAPGASTRNVIQPTGATFTPLIVKGFTSQSATLFEAQDISGGVLMKIDAKGRYVAAQTSTAGSYYIASFGLTVSTAAHSATAGLNITNEANHASGTLSSIYGQKTLMKSSNSVAGTTITTMWGSYIENYHFSTKALGQNYVQELFSRIDANRGGVTTSHILRLNGSHGSNTTIGTFYGILWENTGAGGAVTNYYSMYIKALTGAAAVTNQYGLYMENINKGGTLAYAIYTNAGLIHFGDSLDFASGKSITLLAGNIATDTTTGSQIATGSTQKLGFYGATPVVRPSAYTQTYSTADKTFAAYTSDTESSAYTGIDNLQVGTVYATVADLNALRVAYDNLRVFAEDMAGVVNAHTDDLQALGLTS